MLRNKCINKINHSSSQGIQNELTVISLLSKSLIICVIETRLLASIKTCKLMCLVVNLSMELTERLNFFCRSALVSALAMVMTTFIPPPGNLQPSLLQTPSSKASQDNNMNENNVKDSIF